MMWELTGCWENTEKQNFSSLGQDDGSRRRLFGKGRPNFLIISPTHKHASVPGPLYFLCLEPSSPGCPHSLLPPLLHVPSALRCFLATLFKLSAPTISPLPHNTQTHTHTPLSSFPDFSPQCLSTPAKLYIFYLLTCLFLSAPTRMQGLWGP